MKAIKRLFFVTTICLATSSGAAGGPYTDELSKCLIESTTESDRAALVKWMFAAASLHPSVKMIASVSPEQLEKANKQTAELFTKLITKSCKQSAQKAFNFDGEDALSASFKTLGGVAANELFSSPEVTAGMAGMDKYFDEGKLKAAFETP